MQNNSSADEDEKDEDVEDVSSNEPEAESDKDSRSTLLQLDSNDNDTTAEEAKVDVVLPEVNEIDSKYADSGFWKIDPLEDELDDLLADYEWESSRSWTARTMTLSASQPLLRARNSFLRMLVPWFRYAKVLDRIAYKPHERRYDIVPVPINQSYTPFLFVYLLIWYDTIVELLYR